MRYEYRKRLTQDIIFLIFKMMSFFIVLILVGILSFIVYKGAGVINWEFLTTGPSDGMTKGGIFPAIVGTVYLMAGSALFAFPVGIMSGVYMSEYATNGKVIKFIRIMTNNLSGIPSVVFGLFGMALFVNYLGFGDSIIAGSLTLGLLSLPIVIRTTEEALKDIPVSYREGSLALGATKAQTIWRVILPMGMPRIITGLILSLGRVTWRNSTYIIHLRRILPSSITGKYFRPVHGTPLPPVCYFHQRHGYRSPATYSIRNSTGINNNRTYHKYRCQYFAQVL